MNWLLILGGLVAGSYIAIFIYKTKTGSPYLPSRDQEIKTLLKYIPEKSRVCDFGAGDGRVMLALAKAKKIEVWGWEIEPVIWILSWWRLKKIKNLRGKLHYKLGDMWQVNLEKFNVIIVYQLERFTNRLAEKCLQEMKPGSLVIANTYPIPKLKQIKQDGKIIIYQI